MSQLYDIIKGCLDENELNYDYVEEKKFFHFGLTANNGSLRVGIAYDDDAAYVFTFVNWDGKIPPKSVPAVLPLINEINSSTRFTTLCVDDKDGELSAHAGINLDGTELAGGQLFVTLRMLVSVLDDNIEKLMRAAWTAPSATIN